MPPDTLATSIRKASGPPAPCVLRLTFDSGAELTVGPHPQYEAWQLVGRGVDHLIIVGGDTTPWLLP